MHWVPCRLSKAKVDPGSNSLTFHLSIFQRAALHEIRKVFGSLQISIQYEMLMLGAVWDSSPTGQSWVASEESTKQPWKARDGRVSSVDMGCCGGQRSRAWKAFEVL